MSRCLDIEDALHRWVGASAIGQRLSFNDLLPCRAARLDMTYGV
jgi:hypothetical protein